MKLSVEKNRETNLYEFLFMNAEGSYRQYWSAKPIKPLETEEDMQAFVGWINKCIEEIKI